MKPQCPQKPVNVLILIIAFNLLLLLPGVIRAQANRVVIGYVGGFRGIIKNVDQIDVKKLTHINYAFVDIKNNRAWLHREVTDTINFRRLVTLKKQNPALKILISIGGWTWSGRFSDAVLSDTARHGFAASAVAIISKFNLDGIDIDWEYPRRKGLDGNIYRPEDRQNYTLMFKELRRQLDNLQQQTHKKYLLTTAVGAFKGFLDHTEMQDVQQYLDYINLMTYDYSAGKAASHHTALYASKAYVAHNNANEAVTLFVAAGVPVNKLVMGVAFYGRTSILEEGAKGLGDSVSTRAKGYGYTIIKDSILKLPGFKVYHDRHAKADYIYNSITRQFITFDDEWSVKKKVKYVKSKKMGGVMFWEYADDPKGYLLGVINKTIR
ncbi:chitinase [Mucilaginibacter frigoritolerans]|uniref:chitinase n=1 Tax=Mucilaginibacter frigoritolerans TaxID=652788 RepID=A0A562TRL3_9SPHI|nr:glycoside hydrolase family 18 protein [Mucilaginibacter frigoritolerans]TWI95878.1 chitinase [Mucilaginibacter frigoritolerans]